jgi:hypothetical protein
MIVCKHISGKFLKGAMGVLGVLCLALTSCVKSTSDNIAASAPTALLTVIQASPDEPALTFYLNNSLVSQSSLNYGFGIDYFSAIAGTRIANFYDSSSKLVLASTIKLAPNNAYSLFMDNIPSKPGTLLLNDTLTKPASGNASLRFVNLSPDAPAVDLVVEGGQTLVKNRSFEGFSSFSPIPGKSSYTFQIVKTGTSTVLASLPYVPINNGNVYTIVFEGLANPTGVEDKLTAVLITNAEF